MYSYPFTAEIAEEICDWIAEGKTLRSFCRQQGKPSFKTVYRWIKSDAAFARDMDEARDVGFDVIADETLEIIDTEPEMASSKEGSHRDAAYVAWLKNRVWHRMQLLAKWHPKKYGERMTQELVGKNGGPIQTEELSSFEKARRVAFLLQAGLRAQQQGPEPVSPPEDSGSSTST